MNMSIIAASRLRGVFEANTFIGNVYNSVLTNQGNNSVQLRNESDVANFLNSTQYPVAATDIKNLKNNGRDISFFIDVNYIVSQSFQVIDYYIDLDSNCLNFDLDNIQINTKLYYTPISSLANGAYDQNFLSSRSFNYRLGVHFGDKIGNTVGDDNVFRSNQGNGEFWFDLAQSTINNGSPDGDINIAISEGNTVNYASLTQRQDKPTAATISANTIGGTYVELNVSQPTHVNTLKYALVFVDGFFQDVYDINSAIYAFNLQEQTTYNIKVIIADEYFNISPYSNTLNVTTTIINTALLFQNAVAYYKLDETSGNAIDVVNGYNGVDVGTIVKDGEWYDYGTNESYVEIADNDDFSFVDAGGNNTDFVVKTEVIFDGISDFPRLVSKRENTNSGVQEWELFYNFNSNFFGFRIFDENNNNFTLTFDVIFSLNEKLILGATNINDVIYLFINGEIVASQALPPGFQFFQGNSPVKFGNETFTSNLNLIGRQKETTIIKGAGWTDGDISDNYNNGNGISI